MVAVYHRTELLPVILYYTSCPGRQSENVDHTSHHLSNQERLKKKKGVRSQVEIGDRYQLSQHQLGPKVLSGIFFSDGGHKECHRGGHLLE